MKFFFNEHQFLKSATGQKNKNFFTRCLSVVFLICYKTGLGVIRSAVFLKTKIIQAANSASRIVAADLKKTGHFFPIRLEKFLSHKPFKGAGVFFALILSGFLGFAGLKLIASAFGIKSNIFVLSKQAVSQLQEARDLISQQDFVSSKENFYLAAKTFQSAQSQLQNSQTSLNEILNFLPQKQQAENLLLAARLLSEAGGDFAQAALELKQVSFAQSGVISKKPVAEVLEAVKANLKSAEAKTNQASQLLGSNNENIVPKNYRLAFLEAKQNIQSAGQGLSSLSSAFELISSLVIGDKNVLLVFENNNELRPSGGFIGTFGNAKIKNGQIGKIHISSVYDLDGQLAEKIRPPTPILNVNDRWFLRDSNWFADFAKSGKKISQFYEKEGGETPDIVLALTPNLIVDLLKITGPISLPKYNLILDSENFVEQTQVASSLPETENTPNAPKQVLADFFSIFIQKISQLQGDNWLLFVQALESSLSSKHLLGYSKLPSLQTKLEEYNWAGKILATGDDYLQIVSANLNGSKTDLYIKQKVSLKASVDESGSIINQLSIERKNTLPDMGLSKNLSYIRILVPLGSELLTNEGFDFRPFESTQEKNIKIDPDVLEMEKKSVRDLVSGTTIGQESEKTVFGNWLEVKGGESKTIKLSYKLPFKIGEIGKYSLLFQKQAGSLSMPLDFVLEFPHRKAEWLSFQPEKTENSLIQKQFYIDRDIFFGAVLSKND